MAKPKGTGFIPCTKCGGSGAVDVKEIYKDKKQVTRTRQVRKICNACGGKGGYHI